MLDWLWRLIISLQSTVHGFDTHVPAPLHCVNFMMLAESTQNTTNFFGFIAIGNRSEPCVLFLPVRVVSFPVFCCSHDSIARIVSATAWVTPLSLHNYTRRKKKKEQRSEFMYAHLLKQHANIEVGRGSMWNLSAALCCSTACFSDFPHLWLTDCLKRLISPRTVICPKVAWGSSHVQRRWFS